MRFESDFFTGEFLPPAAIIFAAFQG